jgi:guanylate kinase
MYKIVCIIGKSASGKDHIYRALLEDEEFNFKKIILYTTRPKREGEQEGVEYYFTDNEAADEFEKNGKIIEMRQYETVNGTWKYFTADDGQIDLENGRYLSIGTIESYVKFCEYFGKEKIYPIYIDVEDSIRLERAMKREKKQKQPQYKEMCRRFLADCEDFCEEKLKEAGITKHFYNNGSIEECMEVIVKELRQVLQ